MNQQVELQKLIDAMRKGRQMYPTVKQETNGYLHWQSFIDQPDDDQVCGACAIGFAFLAEGVDTRRKLQLLGDEFSHFPALRMLLPDEPNLNVWDFIVNLNDNHDLPVEAIIEALEGLKNQYEIQ